MALESEKISKAGTRPALVAYLGIPLEVAVPIFVAFFAVDAATHTMTWGLIFLPLWPATAFLVRKDPNGVRIFFIWMRTTATMLDRSVWGGASVSPLPAKAKKER